ncbi:NAD(P)H-flavin reductase [Alteromonadaceae bacterium BrNp21-10]|nr:NAD(P)H-flavin reductase [Alteromonadaceae bacterium BrNp21-10]
MSDILCTIEQIQPLTAFVQKITFRPQQPVNFAAGQYVRVVMGKDDRRPFSLANPSHETDCLELHIGASEQNPYAWEVLQHLQKNSQFHIDGPMGNAGLPSTLSPKPTILLAGGTGFSYTRSILLSLLEHNAKEPIFLYWGTRTIEDMYAKAELETLANKYKHFVFVPVVEEAEEDWQGKTGFVHQAILKDFVSLEPYQVYVAGRFEMAGVARNDFQLQGLLPDNLYGDAYEFI